MISYVRPYPSFRAVENIPIDRISVRKKKLIYL